VGPKESGNLVHWRVGRGANAVVATTHSHPTRLFRCGIIPRRKEYCVSLGSQGVGKGEHTKARFVWTVRVSVNCAMRYAYVSTDPECSIRRHNRAVSVCGWTDRLTVKDKFPLAPFFRYCIAVGVLLFCCQSGLFISFSGACTFLGLVTLTDQGGLVGQPCRERGATLGVC